MSMLSALGDRWATPHLRHVRPHHDSQRLLLQVPQLRELPGVQLIGSGQRVG